MAKADHKNNITWIPYGVAKARSVAYLGDPEFVERELFKGLAARQIGCRCYDLKLRRDILARAPLIQIFGASPMI
jgi:hypothetical protein